MPRPPAAAVDPRAIVDAAGFDLSDVDEVDIVSAASRHPEPRRTNRERGPDDVLAMCALLIFQDRPRKRLGGKAGRALPGI
jgi:hypothetical protein